MVIAALFIIARGYEQEMAQKLCHRQMNMAVSAEGTTFDRNKGKENWLAGSLNPPGMK